MNVQDNFTSESEVKINQKQEQQQQQTAISSGSKNDLVINNFGEESKEKETNSNFRNNEKKEIKIINVNRSDLKNNFTNINNSNCSDFNTDILKNSNKKLCVNELNWNEANTSNSGYRKVPIQQVKYNNLLKNSEKNLELYASEGMTEEGKNICINLLMLCSRLKKDNQ